MAAGVSVTDRSKRAETARPQPDEHCECQFVCDSALSPKSDVHVIELNGATDDENIEDGETGFDDGSAQVRNIRDPPTESEHREHMTIHRHHRSCGVNSPHRGLDAQDDLEGVLHVSMGCGFHGERESEEQVTRVLVIRERRHKMT